MALADEPPIRATQDDAFSSSVQQLSAFVRSATATISLLVISDGKGVSGAADNTSRNPSAPWNP
jgi:hypothetical protein